MSDPRTNDSSTSPEPRLLYCHCTYARVIAPEVKQEVLRALAASGRAFDAVADLCEMSARKDPALERLSKSGPVKIAACFPRAVRWLFHASGAPLPPEGVEVLNMRERSAQEVVERMLAPDLVETVFAAGPAPSDAPTPTGSAAEASPADAERGGVS